MNIWKYELAAVEQQVLSMPLGATILSVQVQYGMPVLYSMANTFQAVEPRHIYMFGTGESMPNIPMTYIGTILLAEDNLVLHVFEVKDADLLPKTD